MLLRWKKKKESSNQQLWKEKCELDFTFKKRSNYKISFYIYSNLCLSICLFPSVRYIRLKKLIPLPFHSRNIKLLFHIVRLLLLRSLTYHENLVNIVCLIRERLTAGFQGVNSLNLPATIFLLSYSSGRVYRLFVHQVLPRPDACFPSSDKNRSLFVRISRIGEVLGMQIPAPRSFLFARCYTPRVCMKRSKAAAVPSSFYLFSSSFQSYSRDSI